MGEKEHDCNKIGEISVITDKLTRLERIIDGNGEVGSGIKDVIVVLNHSLTNFQKTVEGLTTTVSAILKFQNETETAIKMKAKYRANNQWLLGICITLFIALVGILIS